MMNEQNKKHRHRPQGITNLRLTVERLECRRLLAGLNVAVTIDPSLTGVLNADLEIPAANRILYIDLNRNNSADPNDPVAITNENGHAFFDDLESGDYSIGLLTDNYHQRQISPAVVERTKVQATPLPSQRLIGTVDQSLWGLSSDGILTLVSSSDDSRSDDRPVHSSILSIGGSPLDVVQRTPTEFLISYRAANENRLAIFDTNSRELKTRSLPISGKLESLTSNGQTVFGLIKDANESSVARIEISELSSSVTKFFAGQILEVQALGDNLVMLRHTASGKVLEVLDLYGSQLSEIVVPSSANGLKVDPLTSTIALMSSDGAMVYRAIDGEIAKVAILADAVAPIAMSSGRLVSGDRAVEGELVVWSMANWLPLGRLNVGGSEIRDIVVRDLEALVMTNNSVHTLDLHVARPFEIAHNDAEDTNVAFSIHQLAPGIAPVVEAPPTRSIAENHFESIDLRQLVMDDSGQMLWFSVVSQPLHGAVQLTPDGKLEFTPSMDFFGQDSVTVRVHDGVSTADVALNWNIIEANRPPVELKIQVDEMLEGLPAGTVIGTVSVIDPNKNDSYQVVSLDYRFRVENGKVILNEPLDFEAGASILLDLTAIDSLGQHSITGNTRVHITNVVEAPEGIVLSELAIPENVSNVLVGQVQLVSPDSAGVYEINVDDPRFEIKGDELWLLEPLNFEQANNVRLKFSVKDANSDLPTVSNSVSLSVQDRDDKPQAIELNRTQVDARTYGAEVGLISVVDEDGDRYRYSVSDGRFVVVDGRLKLADDAAIDAKQGSTIPLTVTATAPNGTTIVQDFPVAVVPARSPFQNPIQPIDVNGDGRITAADALAVINFLNRYGRGTIPAQASQGSGESSFYPDVDGDGRVTAIDVLKVIQWLNQRSRGVSDQNRLVAEGEGQREISPVQKVAPVQLAVWDLEEERRKNNSRIDAELENLLDQLANDSQ